ncbi:MAG: AAA family ATPase [Nitrospinales bacterium]
MINIIPASLAEKIISEKIKEWENKRKKTSEIEEVKPHPFLTVSRDFGCGEENILPALEKEFGWHVYGKDLLNFVVEQEGVSQAVLETLDEKKKEGIYDWVNFILSSGAIVQKDYVVKVSHIIKTIVSHESAIILGRGGNYILKGKPEGLRLKITAPFDDRVSHISHIREMSMESAKTLVMEKDNERQSFIENYFQENDKGLADFDLVINTNAFNEKSICDITRYAMNEKCNL